MPRLAGQIDVAKTEAILDAASAAMAERGLGVPIEEIARQAGVSKQTIYNHYGSKAELLRAVVTRRVDTLTAPLALPEAAEHPQEALTEYARTVLSGLLRPETARFLRLIALSAAEAPDLAETYYSAGSQSSRARLARFFAQETAAGRLNTPDPRLAADFFSGMLVGAPQFAAILGLPTNLTPSDADRIAAEAAARFMRAFAP